ncbi:MAG: DUF2934 domain-containing protein [Steroidobacter sp.]
MQSRRDSRSDGKATDAQFSGDQTGSAAGVTNTKLRRREIPSFSASREARIAEAAYWRAERRGFTPGQELDDWLEAERQVDAGQEEDEDRRDA